MKTEIEIEKILRIVIPKNQKKRAIMDLIIYKEKIDKKISEFFEDLSKKEQKEINNFITGNR